jgi:hypothetical protein
VQVKISASQVEMQYRCKFLYATADATDSGWCLNDHQGRFILAGSNVINWKHDIIERETMAMKKDISEMIQRCLSRVRFESDSQIVIDAILSRSHGVS